jgi:hypothetical protein
MFFMFSLDMFSTSSLWRLSSIYLHDLVEVLHVLPGEMLTFSLWRLSSTIPA